MTIRNLNGRLKSIERAAETAAPAKPFLFLTQDWENPDLYRGRDDLEVMRPDIEKLAEQFQIICINYGPWPPGGEL